MMNYRGVILDVDGTVVRGDEPIPGARDGVQTLEERGLERVFVSNNPTKPPSAYESRLGRAGFDVTADEVITAGTVTVEYFARRRPEDDLYVVGERGLVEILDDAGLSVVDSRADADVLVASIDRSFDYDTLCEALWLLEDDDVAFVGTDPDMVIPAVERDVPGSGAVINAIAGVSGRDPDTVLGKPSETARTMALDRLGVSASETIVVGDRLDTDIELGARYGMTTVLVETGVTDETTLATSSVEPDFVVESLGEIERVFEAAENR
jgi:4-nitrophenyl phosphatase